MSLALVIKSYFGITLASDSRRTYFVDGDPRRVPVEAFPSHYAVCDENLKLFNFPEPHNFVGVTGAGESAPLYGIAQQFYAALPYKRLTVHEYTERLRDLLLAQPDADLTMLVAGFDPGEKLGRVFVTAPPSAPDPVEQHEGDAGGITLAGQREYADRLLYGFDPRLRDVGALVGVQHLESLHMSIPFQVMPLDACAQIAMAFIEITTLAQSVSLDVAGVGGPVDIINITADSGAQVVQRKGLVPDVGPCAPTVAARMPMPQPEFRPVVTIDTSGDPRRASSYTARFA